jgi:hypothetical protein
MQLVQSIPLTWHCFFRPSNAMRKCIKNNNNKQLIEKPSEGNGQTCQRFAAKRMEYMENKSSGRRCRHEVLKVEDYVKRSDESYVDFQEDFQWIELGKFFTDRGLSKTYKTQKARLQYLTDQGLTTQQDSKGVLGVALRMQEEGTQLMKKGHRLAVAKIKKTDVDSKQEADDLVSKTMAGLQVSSHSLKDIQL